MRVETAAIRDWVIHMEALEYHADNKGRGIGELLERAESSVMARPCQEEDEADGSDQDLIIKGLGNEFIDGSPANERVGRMRQRQRLGGLLNYDARAA